MSIILKTSVYRKCIYVEATSQLRGYTYKLRLDKHNGTFKIIAGCRTWQTFEEAFSHYKGNEPGSQHWRDVNAPHIPPDIRERLIAYRFEARMILEALRQRADEVLSVKFGKQKTYPGTYEVIDLNTDDGLDLNSERSPGDVYFSVGDGQLNVRTPGMGSMTGRSRRYAEGGYVDANAWLRNEARENFPNVDYSEIERRIMAHVSTDMNPDERIRSGKQTHRAGDILDAFRHELNAENRTPPGSWPCCDNMTKNSPHYNALRRDGNLHDGRTGFETLEQEIANLRLAHITRVSRLIQERLDVIAKDLEARGMKGG